MNTYKPLAKPKITQVELRERLEAKGFLDEFNKQRLSLVGVRGYYADTFGKENENDRVFYDDALILTTGGNLYETFNFNVDPSIFKDGVATLIGDESYDVVKHFHKGNSNYPALQIIQDKLRRDGSEEISTGRHGINFHWDNEDRSRFSLGCQTLPKSQWFRFIKRVNDLMAQMNLGHIKYFLLENE